MQIKQHLLTQHLQKKINPIYVLIGKESFLIEEQLTAIKSTLKKHHDYDEKKISIQSAADWNLVLEEANSYSLFSETVLLNLFYDKKSIDATGKKVLTEYLKTINPRCFIILRAPEVPAKQLSWLYQNEQVVLTAAYPLTAQAMNQWIINQLKKNGLDFEPQVPKVIYQYTQGNMLACAQVLEKIALNHPPNSIIKAQDALIHLSDQCDYSLFELIDACLSGQGDKAIHILRQAADNKTEATLVLWMLAQEVRILLQLSYSIQNNRDFNSACSQLKIWPQRVSLYHLASKRFKASVLEQIHKNCTWTDELIKSNQNTQVWNTLERLALSLSLGSWVGSSCRV